MLESLLCRVGDQIGLESLLLPLIQELQGPLWHPALSTCTDHCTVGDHIGLESILLHLFKELQGPLCHPTLSASIEHHSVLAL